MTSTAATAAAEVEVEVAPPMSSVLIHSSLAVFVFLYARYFHRFALASDEQLVVAAAAAVEKSEVEEYMNLLPQHESPMYQHE